ncbi:MAG: AAA-like domain-containing protein [Clostridiales bacterium]|nr:MAG: AAA-like domain-containing protein [Clostridiales bacterium]
MTRTTAVINRTRFTPAQKEEFPTQAIFLERFGRDIFLEPMGEGGNLEYKWNCQISDDYADIMGSSYNCTDYPEAPNF